MIIVSVYLGTFLPIPKSAERVAFQDFKKIITALALKENISFGRLTNVVISLNDLLFPSPISISRYTHYSLEFYSSRPDPPM